MKSIIFTLIFCSISFISEAAGPRSWGKSGTAAITNAVLTVGGAAPFYPASLCIENRDATDSIFIDWTDSIAATVDNTTNLKILPGKNVCFEFHNPNINNLMEIGIIASANTPAYNIIAIGAR
jgi:hypothetical protein